MDLVTQIYAHQKELETKTAKPLAVLFKHPDIFKKHDYLPNTFYDRKRLLDHYTSTHRIAFFTYQSLSEMCEILDRFTATKENIDLVIIHGHGTPDSVGSFDPQITFNTTFPASGCLKNLHSKTTILLLSCSTGKGESNIAQYIAANAGGASVIAPTVPIKALGVTTSFPATFIPRNSVVI
jgi:hypothetical protein